MKSILLIIFITFSTLAFSQRYRVSKPCNINVNDPSYLNEWRKKSIDATFKYRSYDGGYCTGVLINRNVSDENIGFYFITARHCIDQGVNLNNSYFFFNYQSPDEDTASTAYSNKGLEFGQSRSLQDNKHQYYHNSYINLIAWYVWGDFALCEIETPLPPHFNVSYAGWNPNILYNPGTIPGGNGDYVGIHHPRADIKKISGTDQVITLGMEAGCYTITNLFDAIFGTNTQAICNYTDIPWMNIPGAWEYGLLEGGSSGSGLYNSDNRMIGMLSGWDTDNCPVTWFGTYGKFYANYHTPTVRSTLNPSNERSVNIFGMPGRKITCYDNLTLPGGAAGAKGYYFPAEHYQDENKITLSADNDITTNKDITVFDGADYEFTAGNSITLSPGFKVESGANFKASIQGCPSPKKGNLNQMFIDKLRSIKLPDYEKNNIEANKDKDRDFVVVKLSPNPANDQVKVKFILDTDNVFSYQVFNVHGQLMAESAKKNYGKGITYENLSISDWANGMYIVKVISEKKIYTQQFVKQ